MKLDPTVDPGEPPREIYDALARWAQSQPIAIGLDPNHEIVLDGVDVAYRQADDCQPRPEMVVQFTQRRPDLEAEDSARHRLRRTHGAAGGYHVDREHRTERSST